MLEDEAAVHAPPAQKRFIDRLAIRFQRRIPEEWDASACSLSRVLEDELNTLQGVPPETSDAGENGNSEASSVVEKARLAAVIERIHAEQPTRSALCLSGGGIRSATFSLGALQGFARCGLLSQFDYLSTVSGGGYSGSWLSAWIINEPAGLSRVQADLAGHNATAATPEPMPLTHLRAYSNYLTPRLGLFSGDTWSIVATVLRNILLNWCLLLPLLAAFVMLPRLWLMALSLPVRHDVAIAALLASVGLLLCGLSYIGVDLPSVGGAQYSQNRFLALCLMPIVLGVALLISSWAWLAPDVLTSSWLVWFVAAGALVFVAAVCCSAAWITLRTKRPPTNLAEPMLQGSHNRTAPTGVTPALLIVAMLSGSLAGLAGWWLSSIVSPHPGTFASLYIVFAPAIVLVTLAAIATLFIGAGSKFTNDEDREWWSRAGGWLIVVACVWTIGAAITITGPDLTTKALAIGSSGGVAGLLTAVLGYYSKLPRDTTGRTTSALPGTIVLKVAAPVFVACLLVVISLAASWLGDALTTVTAGVTAYPAGDALLAALIEVIAFGGFGLLAGAFINVNKFSLHAMYRNRLVRAYLAAARRQEARRDVSPFTGFAASDTPPLSGLSREQPLHVVNCILNLIAGSNLAWQERKAESFTMSRLHCGSSRVGYRPAATFGNGVTLGTAAAISGAAANPNMGYHSSPVITFLMTFFNARLGYWLGNPGAAGWATWSKSGPRFALRPIIAEALGLTADTSAYVSLSDGGHFENLGLYEMVVRRCKVIVVLDAGCDRNYSFDDLGNAVRKIRIDLGIPIDFRQDSLSHTLAGVNGRYGAIADIRYGCVDPSGTDGILIYLKASVNGSEPADVRNYAATHPEFPHESTTDQWFTESQFESYRALGSHILDFVVGRGRLTIPDLRTRAEERLMETPI